MRILHVFGSIVILASSGVLAGCDDTFIDPFANDGKYFTVYGYLDASKNFQSISHTLRVIPVTRTPERIEDPSSPGATIDARVFTTDLATGLRTEWRHSLDRLANGRYGHIFRAAFFVEPNRTYRLEVVRSDGIVTYAETTVPAPSSVRPVPAAPLVSMDSSLVTQDVLLPSVGSIWDLDVIYRTGENDCSPAAVPYGRVGRPTDAGWAFTIDLTRDVDLLSRQLGAAPYICTVGLRARILDPAWLFPEGDFDPATLARPDALTNVVNGYGFFGSIGLLLYDWPVDDALRDVLDAHTP